MIEVVEYVDASGVSVFGRWIRKLDPVSQSRVFTTIGRLGCGNFSDVKGVGSGVFEIRLHFGPGYRVYFGKDGVALVILLAGGTKLRQEKDIELAHDHWRAYKHLKKEQA